MADIDYKLLKALSVVVQEGGFEKASRVLHISQPAVSQRVKLLEEQTGQVLLTRTSPPASHSVRPPYDQALPTGQTA